MASPTRWTWVWANSRSWWWTGTPGVLQSMGSQRVRHDWATELNWSNLQPTDIYWASTMCHVEEEVATHSSILVWEIPQTEKAGGLQSMELQSWIRRTPRAWSCMKIPKKMLSLSLRPCHLPKPEQDASRRGGHDFMVGFQGAFSPLKYFTQLQMWRELYKRAPSPHPLASVTINPWSTCFNCIFGSILKQIPGNISWHSFIAIKR